MFRKPWFWPGFRVLATLAAWGGVAYVFATPLGHFLCNGPDPIFATSCIQVAKSALGWAIAAGGGIFTLTFEHFCKGVSEVRLRTKRVPLRRKK